MVCALLCGFPDKNAEGGKPGRSLFEQLLQMIFPECDLAFLQHVFPCGGVDIDVDIDGAGETLLLIGKALYAFFDGDVTGNLTEPVMAKGPYVFGRDDPIARE